MNCYDIRSASLDITYRCNLKCRHCFNRSGEIVSEDELSDFELANIASQLGNLALDSVCLCGGEPLLRFAILPDLIKLLKRKNRNTVVSMVTNGTLLTQNKIDALKNAGLDRIQFSIDGISDESYDYVRKTNGLLDRAISMLEACVASGLEVMVASLPHQANYSEFNQIIDFCVSRRVSELRVQPLMPIGRAGENYSDLSLSQEEYATIRSMLQSANQKYPQMKFEWGDPVDHFFMLQEASYLPMITISAFGECLVSPYLPYAIWDLRRNSLSDYLDMHIPEKALLDKKIQTEIRNIYSVADLAGGELGIDCSTGDRRIRIVGEM